MPDTELSPSVHAVFGGEDVQFTLPRVSRNIFGLLTHSAPWETESVGSFDLLKRFIGGTWLQVDLARVLTCAHPEYKPDPLGSVNERVAEVLRQNGPGNYALLAMKILHAHLYGLPPAEATFDENEQMAAGYESA